MLDFLFYGGYKGFLMFSGGSKGNIGKKRIKPNRKRAF